MSSVELSPYNFTITDQSPLFQYLPTRNGPIASSWNVSYSSGEDPGTDIGTGSSSHLTTLAGASVQLAWTGSAVYLYGTASGQYTIQLDGAQTNGVLGPNNLLYSATNLSYGSHTVVFRLLQGTAYIYSANVTVGVGEAGSSISSQTIPTTSVPLSGDASNFTLSSGWVAQSNYGSTNVVDDRIGTYSEGGSISFPLTSAAAFYVTGSVATNHGQYDVKVTPQSNTANQFTGQYNGSSSYVGLDEVIFMMGGLNMSETYEIQLTNDVNQMWFDISSVVVLSAPLPSASPSSTVGPRASGSTNSGSSKLGTGAIAGIAVGGFCVLAFGILALALCFKRQQRQPPMQRDPFMIEHDQGPSGGVNPYKPTISPNVSYYDPHGASHGAPLPQSQPQMPYEWSPADLTTGAAVVRSQQQHQYNANSIPSSSSPTSERPLQPYHSPNASYSSPSPRMISYQSGEAEAIAHSLADRGTSPSITSSFGGMRDYLTEQQAENVHGLLAQNVPPAVVASVIERMLREGDGASTSAHDSRSIPAPGSPGPETDLPPNYEFKMG